MRNKPYNYIEISKEYLFEHYIVKKKASRQIAKELGITKGVILNRLKEYGMNCEQQLNHYNINQTQHDLIVGNILGDGTFCTDGNDYRMSFRQAESQKEYLKYKFEIMEPFCKKKSVGISDGNKKATNGRSQLMYYFHTRALPLFNKYQKMSIEDCLNELNDSSFSWWMMDDGTFTNINGVSNSTYTLSASRFNIDQAKLTQKLFKEKFNIESTIQENKKRRVHSNGKTYAIHGFYFPASETEKVRQLILSSEIGNGLFTTMSYKLQY